MKILMILLCLNFISACAPQAQKTKKANKKYGLPNIEYGYLSLSPFQIAAGLLEGISSVPYYLSTNLPAINQGLLTAQADISLDDTYKSAYSKALKNVPQSGDTGIVFKKMKRMTEFFQKVLKQYGVHDSKHYILTAIEEKSDKYTLLAVVYRPIKDKNKKPIDTIIDWAVFPQKTIQTQKAQAILITLAANSILNDKKTPEYWDIKKRWQTGDAHDIIKQRFEDMNKRMGL